ncbi:LAMI_0H16160g1_1 [Lachancea mirantina]|uniref:LAMI_0H16160g1_1 n=1 Tax=Lachancea mirantina TaxID=1230905 RepID=A0A1G4KJ11_9SACH|nr:LAMI_0H16160g1_1 [Lachancea mirantina]
MVYYTGTGAMDSPTFGKSLSLRVDGGFNAVSISPCGRDVVLASQQGLYVIDLDDPFSPPRWLHHITSWEVADVQWSPHQEKPYWVVSTSNQKALVWNLARQSSRAIEHVLHGHSRAITDINFHPGDPNILATCSIDAYVHSWDMRMPWKPYYSASAWRAGASQVKWSHLESHILASAHANDVYVWDLRKGCSPLFKFQGHGSSVNSIDLSRSHRSEIMSSSNDGTVKFWDFSKGDKQAIRTVETEFPVWRGRYLPFGEGFCIMPMAGGNNSVYLSSLNFNAKESASHKFQPTYVFRGHSDRVTDFLWRSRHSTDTDLDDREFQLVTWSKDCDLRLWPVSDAALEKLSFKKNQKLDHKLPDPKYVTYRREPKTIESQSSHIKGIKGNFVTKSGLESLQGKDKVNHLDWVSGVKLRQSTSQRNFYDEDTLQNLGEEVSVVGHKFSRIVFEKISVSTGKLVITLNGPWSDEDEDACIFLRLEIQFPPNYPNKGSAPTFKIEENRELTEGKKAEIMQNIHDIAIKYTDVNRYCLEPCLRFVLGEKVDLDHLDDEEQLLNLGIIDEIGLEESSLSSSNSKSQVSLELPDMSDSDISDVDSKVSGGRFAYNTNGSLTLDSTPVPKGCGACWAPDGRLVCFFMNNKSDKKQQPNLFKIGHRGLTKRRDSDVANITEIGHHNENDVTVRPKRYVDTLTNSPNNKALSMSAMDDDNSSESSSDSFGDDWDDIIRRDMTLRTKIPLLAPINSGKAGTVSESAKSQESSRRSKNIVIIRDFGALIPDNRELAEKYMISGTTPEEIAKHNAIVAEKAGQDEISQCWRIVADVLIAHEDGNTLNPGWDQHELGGRWFARELMSYFEKVQNLQMLAMLSCIFTTPVKSSQILTARQRKPVESIVSFFENPGSVNGSQEFLGRSATGGLTLGSDPALQSLARSNNIGPIPESGSIGSGDYFVSHHDHMRTQRSSTSSVIPAVAAKNYAPSTLPTVSIKVLNDEFLDLAHQNDNWLLDPRNQQKYDSYRHQYGELLFYWGLPLARVEILKMNESTMASSSTFLNASKSAYGSATVPRDIAFGVVECDGHSSNTACNYCGLKVTRRAFICGNCQHVLHANCATEWWTEGTECPSGCGCVCLEMFDVA